MSFLIDTAMRLSDAWVCLWPQSKPSNLNPQTRIISHRGVRDNRNVLENTFAAMDPLVVYNATKPRVPVWGIECDVRWTADLEPVIFHDPDLRRVLNSPEKLCDLNFATLRSRFPQVPHLRELAQRYGGKLHLMLEVKSESYPDQSEQNERLLAALGNLQPQADYHLYSFDTALLDRIDNLPPAAKIAIALFNRTEVLRAVLEQGYAGLGAHYTVMNQATIDQLKRHEKHGCIGMVDSKNSLYRELKRGADWLFSNDAIRIARHCTALS